MNNRLDKYQRGSKADSDWMQFFHYIKTADIINTLNGLNWFYFCVVFIRLWYLIIGIFSCEIKIERSTALTQKNERHLIDYLSIFFFVEKSPSRVYEGKQIIMRWWIICERAEWKLSVTKKVDFYALKH